MPSVLFKLLFTGLNIKMIKAVILDVDGVIIGEKEGFNFPFPNPEVIQALKAVEEKGVKISLCTARPHVALDKIISAAALNNIHITDGGGVILNPFTGKVVKQYPIEPIAAAQLVERLLEQNIYVEIYTVEDYFVQKNQQGELTNVHEKVLQRKPVLVDSIIDKTRNSEVVKMMLPVIPEKEKGVVEKICQDFTDKIVLSWGIHPIALPVEFAIITAVGVSKTSGAKEVAKNLGVSFEEMLGVGDSGSDWQFINLTKYGASVSNAADKLKELVLSKGEEFGYIGPSVDENGIIDIFKHFKLL